MPALFVLAIVFAIIGALVVLGSFAISSSPSDRAITRRIGEGVFALALVLVFFSSIATVGTRDVGIITAFGRTEGHLSNGLHFKAPWESVTSMDAAIQTDSHTGGGCLNVRIANQQTACVDVSIRWRIREGAGDSLYQNYHTFDHVRDSLVTRELTSAVNNQLANYNPLNSVSITGTPSSGETPNPPLTTIATRVASQMRAEIGGNIDVLNVIIPILSFDQETQSRINQLQQQVAQTRIAEQQELTNQAQAKANQALAKSVNTSPNVLVSECMSALAIMAKAGDVPIGFSCWPGGGSVSGIIANGSTSATTTTGGKP